MNFVRVIDAMANLFLSIDEACYTTFRKMILNKWYRRFIYYYIIEFVFL